MCCCDRPNTDVKDPVCGMTVDPTKAVGSSEYQGTTYSFCSANCKRKFDTAPDQYGKPSGCCSSAPKAEEVQTVIDPVCGMKVDTAKAAASIEHNGTMFYFCSQGCATKFNTLTRSLTPPVMPTSLEEFASVALLLCERVELGPRQLFCLVGVGLSNFQVEAESNSPLFEDIAIQENNVVSALNGLEKVSNEPGV